MGNMPEPDDMMELDPPAAIEPEPTDFVQLNVEDVDPDADKEDAAEARAKRTGGREVRVTSDRRTTTISAE